MSLQSEIVRLRTELARDEIDCRRGGKQPKWLEPGTNVSGGTWVTTLSDEWINSMPQVDRDTEVRDAKVEFLSLRMRPAHKPNFLFLERNSRGAIARKRSIGLASTLTVDEARVQALQMEAENRGLVSLRSHVRCPRNATISEAWDRYCTDGHARDRDRLTRLVGSYLQRYDQHRVSETRRDGVVQFIQRESLRDPTHAHEVHKRLRAFFSWCVNAGALDGNPLGGAPMPERVLGPRKKLAVEDLGIIYGASKNLQEPWTRLVGFVMLTGVAVERARRLQGANVNLTSGVLVQSAKHAEEGRSEIMLSDRAIAYLQPRPIERGYVFQTLRGARFNTPAHLRPSILDQLWRLSGITDWSWRDLTKNVQAQMRILAVTKVVCGEVRIDQKASAESWAETLEHFSAGVEADPLHGVDL